MKRVLLATVLAFTIWGCAVAQTFVRALGTGGAAAIGAIVGFFLGAGPFGAAIGALIAGSVAYLFAENGVLKDQVAHVVKEVHRTEQTASFLDKLEAYGLHALVFGVFAAGGMMYWRHKSTRTAVNSVASKVANGARALWQMVSPRTKQNETPKQ